MDSRNFINQNHALRDSIRVSKNYKNNEIEDAETKYKSGL